MAADLATIERMLPSDVDQEIVDHIARAKASVAAALKVFKDRDREVRDTYGFKR